MKKQNDAAQEKQRELTANGYYTAPKPPYGYKIQKITRPNGEEVKKLKPYQPEADIVRLIYNLYIKDISIGEIGRRLKEAGYPSPGGAESWTDSTLVRLLFDKAVRMRMLGCAIFGAREKDKLKDVSNWTIKSDAHEAIITREMCDAVDSMRSSPNHGRGGARNTGKRRKKTEEAEMISVSEAAALTGISDRTLRRMCVAGDIPGVQLIGKTHVIPRYWAENCAEAVSRSVSYNEAAEIAGVTVQAISSAAIKGKLQRVGKRITKDSLNRYIEMRQK